MIDSFATAVDNLSAITEPKWLVSPLQHTHYSPSDHLSSSLVTLDRDSAVVVNT